MYRVQTGRPCLKCFYLCCRPRSVTSIEKPSFAKQLQICFSAVTGIANPGQLLLLKKPVLPNKCKCRKAGRRGCCQTGTHKSKWGSIIAANKQRNKQTSKQTYKQTNKSRAEQQKIAAGRRKKTETIGLEMQSGQY